MIIRSVFSRSTLLYGLLALSLLTTAACSDDDDDDGTVATDTDQTDTDDGDDDAVQETVNDDGTSQFIVPLSAEQEVPPLDIEDAEGEGNLTIDKASGLVSGSVSVSGLTDQATAAHIHRAFAGIAGGVLIGLTGNEAGTVWTVPDGEDGTLDTDGLAALDNGELYINVHTPDNPGGEIRGQIIPEGILLEDSELSPEEEVVAEGGEPVVSDASGLGVSTVNSETGAISATIFLENLAANAAHIHTGAEGENGDIIITLVQDAEDPSIWRTPAGATLTSEQVDAYEAEGLYFNAHSDAYPAGEIRGQL